MTVLYLGNSIIYVLHCIIYNANLLTHLPIHINTCTLSINSSYVCRALPSLLRYRDEFVIPELPRGQHLVINILTTWGDRYYVGLNGIEIFSNTGELVTVTKVRPTTEVFPCSK